MHNTLQKIITKTKEEVKKRKTLERTSRFQKAMLHPKKGTVAFIAEIKLASPTKGDLGKKEDIVSRAKAYEKAGADAISIVTEAHFFKGNIAFIKKVKKHVLLPILQKDFVIDIYQIYEAKEQGADALLLIARLVSKEELIQFVATCHMLGIEPVVEVHSKEDLQKALATQTKIIAVNARDLDTFTVAIAKACEIIENINDTYIRLGFSGVSSKKEKDQYEKAGANGILIGTGLMQAKNIDTFIGGLV